MSGKRSEKETAVKVHTSILAAAAALGLAVPVAGNAAAPKHRHIKPPVMPALQRTNAIPGSCTLTMTEGYLSIYVCTGGAAGAPALRVTGKGNSVKRAAAPHGCALPPADRQLSGALCIL